MIRFLYVGGISNKNATENTVINYLREEYPDDNFIVEKLPTIGNNSVFKIGVRFSLCANLLQPNF